MMQENENPPIPYPPALETWWLDFARRNSGARTEPELWKKLAPIASQIGDFFTTHRHEGMDQAYQDSRQAAAYGLFFFPQTYVRMRFILEELRKRHQWPVEGPRPLRILDIGAGSGAAGISISHFLEAHGIGCSVTAVEAARTNVEALRRLSSHAKSKTQWDIHHTPIQSWMPPPSFRWDLIVFSFSLNEITGSATDEEASALLESWISRLSPPGLLIITEPSLQATSTRLQKIRDILLSRKAAHVWAPCLHSSDCPMLQQSARWCHEVRRWTAPLSLRKLNNSLHRDIETVKFSFLVLGTSAPATHQIPVEEHVFRLVSPVRKTAGRLMMAGCNSEGKIAEYDLLTRNLGKQELKSWEKQERGGLLKSGPLQNHHSPDNYRLSEPTII